MKIYFKFLEAFGWKMFIVQTCWPSFKGVHKDNIYELSTWLKYSLAFNTVEIIFYQVSWLWSSIETGT